MPWVSTYCCLLFPLLGRILRLATIGRRWGHFSDSAVKCCRPAPAPLPLYLYLYFQYCAVLKCTVLVRGSWLRDR